MRSLWMMTTALMTVYAFPAQAATVLPRTMDAQIERLHQSGEYTGPVKGEEHAETPAEVPPQEQLPAPQDMAPASAPAITPAAAPAVNEGEQAAAPAEEKPAEPAAGYQSMINSQGSGAISPLPLEIHTNGQASYISGGISDEEMDMLKAHANEFNLHVLMRTTGGGYFVADSLRVTDSTGLEIINIEDAGPYLYAALKPGKYTIEAKGNGETKTTEVTIAAKGRREALLSF